MEMQGSALDSAHFSPYRPDGKLVSFVLQLQWISWIAYPSNSMASYALLQEPSSRLAKL